MSGWLNPERKDPTTSIIIVHSGLDFWAFVFIQELRCDRAASNLYKLIVNTATVIGKGRTRTSIDELVVGIVKLSAGDMIPADVLLLESRDFSFSSLA